MRSLLLSLLLAASVWVISSVAPAQSGGTASLSLTTEEKEWLQHHAASDSLFFNTSFPPIEFASRDSQFIGMGADVIALIEKQLGVTFPKRPCRDWNYHLSALASGECAIAPTIVHTVDREDYTLFTTPYATVPVVIITAQSTRGSISLDELAGQRVAVVSGFATEKYLTDQARGRFEIVPVRDVSEGLRSLAFGQVDAFVENLAVAAYYIQLDGIPSLRVAGTTDYSFAWSIGVSHEYPLLHSAIQKALDAIPASELEAVRKHWISLEVQQGLDPELMRWLRLGALFVAALILCLTGITFVLKRRLNERISDLRESEKRLRELFNLAPVPMLIVTKSGTFVDMNESFVRLTGYTLQDTPDLEHWWPRAYPDPAYRQHVIETWGAAVSNAFRQRRAVESAEYAVTCKDGTVRSLLIGASFHGSNLIVILYDISDRKQSEEALRESEDRYRNFVKNATEGIYRIDFVPPVPLNLPERELIERLAQSAIVGEVNEHLARMYGLSESAMIGRLATDFAPGYGERALLAIREPHFQVTNQETQDVDSAGQAVFLIESFTGVVEDGFLTNIWGVQRDITERKRAEEKLRSSEERFRRAFETSPDAVTISKLSNGEFVSTNEGFSRISGYSAEETIGKTSEEIGIWKDIEDRTRLIEALRSSGTVRDFETQFRVKKGFIDGSLSASIVELDGEPHLLAIIRDITDRKRADQLLRESENLLRQAQRVAHLGHYVFDAVSGTWTSSEGLDEIFGIGRDYPRDLGGWSELLHPEQRDEMMVYLRTHVLQQHNVFDREYRIVRASDHEVRWVHGLGRLEVRDGVAIRMFGTIQDITERKHAEEELLLKDRALSSSANAVMINDLRGKTLYVNDSFLKMFGYSKQAAYRLTAPDLAYYPEENDLVFNSIRAKGFFLGETTGKRRDGSPFPIQCSASAIVDTQGQPIAMMGSFVDISQRRKAEQALKESERKLREAQEMAHLGHWTLDVKTGAVEWSDEIYKIFGLDPREFTPHIDAILDLSPWPEDHARDKEIIRRSIETRQPGSYEQKFIRPDGSIGYYYSTFQGNFAENGDLVSIVGTVLDITERKRAEEALRQNSKRVEALLKLNQMTDATLKEVTDYALEEAVSITESKLGYLAFLNEDETVLTMHSWSIQAMKECAIVDKPIRYVVSETGLWGEAVRQRRAVITNDYAAPSPWKKGHPDGHVQVKRHMNVPIFVGNHIVAVAGVGNKESDYDENDAKQLTLLMEGMYRLVERLNAESALAESERKFRTLFENMREGVALHEVIYDDRGNAINYRILEVNSAYEQHTGISPDQARGILATDLYGIDTPPYLDRWALVAETGVPDLLETYFEPMQRHFRISVVSPARGTFATVFLDITEQRAQEAAIREREEKLRSIFRVAPIGIGLVKERTIVDVNEHLCQMTGYLREELLNQSARMLYPTQEDFEYVGREKYRQISEHGTGTVETHWQHKDGSIRNIVLSSSPLDVSDLQKGVTFTALDITDRKRAEEAVREKAEELDRYFTSALDLLCIADTDGNFRRLNKEWEAVLGYPLAELTGKRFLDFVHPEDLQLTLEAVAELAEQKEVISFSNRYRCKDNTYRWIEWRSFPQGNLIYACARDVTDRKRAEEEIRKLNEELEQRVVERTAQLQAANKELEAFSYSVSHDLRAPLRALDGFSRILLEDYAAQLPEEAVRHLNRVRGGAVQMGRLIDDLLRFSRLNRQPLDRQPINMTLLVNDVWDSLASDRENRKVVLSVDTLPDCQGDTPLLKQVWANLLGNALKYTRTREEARVEVGYLASVQCGGKSIQGGVYFVRDNGVGFDMQFADKLFRVFQRLHRQDEYEGTGVGLAIVRRIIARHGGVIWADSMLDSGTTFYFSVSESLEEGMQYNGAESNAAIASAGVPVS